ncbi:hypothetical protein ACH5RR_002894 [Cinchona calisaya]|uniref:CCHC-type domain-containing protein n=1 Tax=Cinchona calisaya TaxID=153742 RepID=A0ABD3ATD7_9GENT
MILPIPAEKRWPPMPELMPKFVLPPPLRRTPGRLRNRRREVDDAAPSSQTKRSNTVKCSNCGAFGHNKRTCQRAPVNTKKGSTSIAGLEFVIQSVTFEMDHAQGYVSIVHFSQGSNPSPTVEGAAVTVQLNVQATTSTTSKRKRGKVGEKSENIGEPTDGRQPMASTTTNVMTEGAPAGTSMNINSAAIVDSSNSTSSFSMCGSKIKVNICWHPFGWKLE